jgi:hypothetical protein
MAVTINASTSAGLINTADTSGILQLQTANVTALTIDASQNVGLGATPAAWVGATGFQVRNTAIEGRSGLPSYGTFSANGYTDSGTWKYISTDFASRYTQFQSQHLWYTAPSGTAGNAITFTQAMTLDASGNLGIGTTSPSYRLTAAGASTSGSVTALAIENPSTNPASEVRQEFLAGGSTWAYLTSSYNSNSPYFAIGVSGAERARIDSSGNFAVGSTSNSDGRIKVDATSGTSINCAVWAKNSAGSASGTYVCWNAATTGNNGFMDFYTEASATLRGTISYNRAGGLTAYNTTSDYRAKTVTGAVQNALSKVALLKPSTGRMNGATEDIDFFVAHELQEVVPSAVTGEKDAVNEDNTPKYQMVDKSALIPLLTAAIQEQQALIETLTQRITVLEGA